MQVNSTYAYTGMGAGYAASAKTSDRSGFSFEDAYANAAASDTADDNTGSAATVQDLFEILNERHQLSKEDLDDEDWRDMSDEAWDKLLEGIDDYLDDYREQIEKMKELQDKAANAAVVKASTEFRAQAASSAALRTSASGFVSTANTADSKDNAEESWTYDLKTEDEAVLARAQQANELRDAAVLQSQKLSRTSYVDAADYKMPGIYTKDSSGRQDL